VMKRGNSRGAKGSCQRYAESDVRRFRLCESTHYGRNVFTQRPRLWRKAKLDAFTKRNSDSRALNPPGKPDAGNPHVRFDEGDGHAWAWPSAAVACRAAPVPCDPHPIDRFRMRAGGAGLEV